MTEKNPSASYRDDPNPQPEVRPMKRWVSRILVTFTILFVLFVSYLAARVVIDADRDPAIREQMDQYRSEQEKRNPLLDPPPEPATPLP
jgi:hypothetical protein